MARYLKVSAEIAEQVGSGTLRPGDDLPSIRDSARSHGTTTSTIGRAYRRLAEAGIIATQDRRRACVAEAGALAARRLLGTAQVFRLAGSDDPVARALAESMQQELERIFRLLGLLYPHLDIHSAYVGLQSKSVSVHDNALEFLDNVLKPQLRETLV